MIDLPFDAESRLSCDICLKEVPASEAASAEAVEYVLYFWGIECYDRWQRKCAEAEGSDPEADG